MSREVVGRGGARIVLDEQTAGRLNARLNGIVREPMDDLEYSWLDRMDGLPRIASDAPEVAAEGSPEPYWADRFLDSPALLVAPFSVGAVGLIVVVGVMIARSLGWL